MRATEEGGPEDPSGTSMHPSLAGRQEVQVPCWCGLQVTGREPWAIKRCPMQTCKNTSWAALCTHKSELRPKAGNRQQEATSRQLVHTRAGRAGKAEKPSALAARLEPGGERCNPDSAIMQEHAGCMLKGTNAKHACCRKIKGTFGIFWANFSQSQNTSGQVHIPSLLLLG